MASFTNTPRTGAACAAPRRVPMNLALRIRHAQADDDLGFVTCFPAMVAAVEAGFRREEALLERLRYRYLHDRRAEDAVILWALHRAAVMVEQGDVDVGRQVVAALDGILMMHRLTDALASIRLRWRRARMSGRAWEDARKASRVTSK
jgi:hemerythrin